MLLDSIHFEFDVDLKKSLDASSAEKRIIFGYASTPHEDIDGEVILPEGLDVSYFKNYGFFNYDHEHGPHAIIGYPYPDEVRVDKTGFYVAGELFKGIPYADSLWNLINVLYKENVPRSLAFSVEGRIIERDGPVIRKAMVTEVAITPRPANPNATLQAVLKSFSRKQTSKALEAGYAVCPEEMTGGGALRVESIDGAKRYIRSLLERRKDIIEYLESRADLDLEEAALYLFLKNPKLESLLTIYNYGGASA